MKANIVHIFEIDEEGVKEWVAATSLKDAKAAYIAEYSEGYLDDALASGYSFRALTPREMDTFRFHITNDDDVEALRFNSDYDDENNTVSFRSQLRLMVDRGDKFPIFFGCSEG